MSSKIVWGELVRSGGSEESPKVPSVITLTDNPTFFGRLSQPQAGANFVHADQYVIECLFISSTHFSIGYEVQDNGVVRYNISDFSRNGTFLDGELIGNNSRSVVNGAEITLRYKDKVKIAYRFNAKSYPDPQPVTSPTRKSKSTDIDTATTALTQQITILQEEMRKMEAKSTIQEERNEEMKRELDAANRKNRQTEKLVEQFQRELLEAKERISSTEANASAVQARVIRLENEVEEAEHGMKEQRGKISSLQDDLKAKNEQLETLRKVIADGNQALAQEKSNRLHTETSLQEIEDKLQQSHDKNHKLATANRALQSMVVEQEVQKATLKEHISTHRAMIIAIQQRVQEQSRVNHVVAGKLHDLLQLFGQINTSNQQLIYISDQQLLRDIDEFLAAPELIVSNITEEDVAVAQQAPPHSAEVLGTMLAARSIPHSNNVLAPATTLTSHGTQGNHHMLGSEDSSVSKRGNFNFTQVPFSEAINGDDEQATFATNMNVQEAIMEVDEEDDDDDGGNKERNNTRLKGEGKNPQRKVGIAAYHGTDEENSDDENSDGNNEVEDGDGHVAAESETQIPLSNAKSSNINRRKKPSKQKHFSKVDDIESPYPNNHAGDETRIGTNGDPQVLGGVILSQESNIRKTGSSPSKSELNISRESEAQKSQLGYNESEYLYTSTPAPLAKRRVGHGQGSQDSSYNEEDGDEPRAKRQRAEETTFMNDSHGLGNTNFISPPRSFDISRDLLGVNEDDADNDMNTTSMIVADLREEDRQRTVDATVSTGSRLEVSSSGNQEDV